MCSGGGTVHVFVPNRHGSGISVRCMRPYDEYRQFTPNPEGGARSNAMLFDNRQQKNSECQRWHRGGRADVWLTVFIFFTHNTTQHPKYNKTKQQTHTQHLKVQSKGRERGKDNKNHTSLLHTITYIQQKTLPSINGRRPGPTDSRRCTLQVTICRRLRIQYVFPHMCGVIQFCIIVFFAAVKPANNILFCIELIQRPESSLRRHKLGLTDQSIRSNDDKTRFTFVHRLMTIGHSQNIWRKVPDEAVLHIWQLEFDCSFILNLL